MGKILISNIGTGDREKGYSEATYEYKGKQEKTSFIAKALITFLDIDKLFLVGTKKSIWDNVYEEFNGEEEKVLEIWDNIKNGGIKKEELEIISNQIDTFLQKKGSKCFLIDYGVEEKELWNNFEIFLDILENLDDEDEIYFDITHSFRSLALMNFIMLEFANTIKNKKLKVNGVFYGMFEYRFENNGITPIVDLKILFDLLEWIKAINNFINYANSDEFIELLDNKEEKNFFDHFSKSLQMGNLESIRNNIKKANKVLHKLNTSDLPIIKLLTPKIEEFVEMLNKEKESDFQLAVAEWFFNHKNYALSYIALVESIVTKVCEIKGYDLKNKDLRDQAKRQISSINKSLYYDIFRYANEVRRDIAHQIGQRGNNIVTDVKRLQQFIKHTNDIFNNLN